MTFVAGIVRRKPDAHEVLAHLLDRCRPEIVEWRTLAPSGSTPPGKAPSTTPSHFAIALALASALPEDAFDRQPLETERYILAGDIRVDNRDELAALLGIALADGRRKADSDLFLEAWQAWGKGALNRIIGGFAVAIWDRHAQELCLVRDHPGERPVYYANTAGTLAFASMPRALRGLPDIDTGLDEDHLLHYLALVPVGSERSFFKNIELLPPAHYLTFRDGVVTRKRYWHPIDAPSIRLRSNRDYEEALLEIFDAAVKARLRTTGAVGAQLSGGMDSSSVAATAARLMGGERLTAFTAVPQSGFADQNPTGRFGNEGPAAALVAAMYPNIDHLLVDPSTADLIRVIEDTGRLTDTPVFNPMNQMWLNTILDRARSKGITVMLQGVCGNATLSFGGLIGLSDLAQGGRWLTLVKQIHQLRSKGHTSWRGGAYWALGPVLPLALRRFIGPQASQFDFAFSPVLPERAHEHNLRARAFQEFFSTDKNSQAFRRNMFDYYDAGYANGGASLGWGISLRDPMQDKRVFDFCFAIPIEQYLAEGQTRSLVRRAMRNRLPAETLACTTRGLQAADWFLTMGARRAELAAELKKIKQSPTARRLLDLDRLQQLLDTWPDSGYELPEISDSYHLALIRGLSAGNFMRNFEGIR
jgi:asparagine synthase (glutamine-hydrolysing)